MQSRLALMAVCLIGATGTGALARDVVPFESGLSAGTVVIRTAERRLYYVRGDGTALRYRIAVGRPGKQWFGEARIDGKYVKPAWAPPAEVKRDNPRLPDVIPGGASNNPMGVRALTLDRDEYAIHGTNRPDSIGTFASYGSIRMLNADILDLYEQVAVGTRVVVER
ncbi:L,D-transpeptidase [Microvirga antarctica]|uniref:L,D-transpeptidase n=1 Tax=Microvirga antarctica TaxID=2819233 RepID=UPI001B308FDA|nr:L,D-transpeptidase [Microvirga antarctica]